MNEVFVLYRDLKVQPSMSEPHIEKHPFHGEHLMTCHSILIQNVVTGKCRPFQYWKQGRTLTQSDLRDFFYYTLKESYDVTTMSYQEYIDEFENGDDRGRNRDLYAYMSEQAEKVKFVDPEFDFEEADGMDDCHIFDNRITFRQEVRDVPQDEIMVWDDQWIEATYSYEPVSHPGGDSIHSYPECWVDVKNRYPMDTPWYWTYPWAEIKAQSSSDGYNIKPTTVQPINSSPTEDDDYYATL